MLTFPVRRRQSDVHRTNELATVDYHPRPVLDTSDLPSVTRQEFKDDADVNVIMKRFGVTALSTLQGAKFGDYDYTIDLQTALDAIEKAETGYYRLPPELRAKYPNWQSVILALADGTKASEIQAVVKSQLSQRSNDDAPRPDSESSGEGTAREPGTSQGRGTVPDGGNQRTT